MRVTGLLVAGALLCAARTLGADACRRLRELPHFPAAIRLSAPVTAFATDVHKERGFRCVDCHGGDPTTQDKARAKDPARGYRGKPAGTQIVATCARCHSDARAHAQVRSR